MHPRNPYKDKPPDFKALALEYPDFRKFCHYVGNGKVSFDFSKDAAVRCLTKTLLKNDFELEVEIPPGYLVPRVPQKLNYCLLIDDLLRENKITEEIVGIDIGTGTSCIHALIGARRFGWKFLATEGDEKSVQTAHENVARNGLESEICVVRVNPEVKTVLLDVMNTMGRGPVRFAFCMCNPPFFEKSEKEERFCEEPALGDMAAFSNRVELEDGRPAPRSATFASAAELCVEGGEVAFVNRIIDDSVLLRDRIKIYTTMLGRKQSVKPLQNRLLRFGDAVKCHVSPLNQGKTKRWMLAWTFVNEICLVTGHQRPVTLECPKPGGLASVCQLLSAELSGRVCHVTPDTVVVEFRSATWIHRRQRKRADADLRQEVKRPRLNTSNAACEANLGAGDGKDSYTDAGNFSSSETLARSVTSRDNSTQTYLPLPAGVPPKSVIKMRISCEKSDEKSADLLCFELISGQKHHIHQLVQHLKNAISRRDKR